MAALCYVRLTYLQYQIAAVFVSECFFLRPALDVLLGWEALYNPIRRPLSITFVHFLHLFLIGLVFPEFFGALLCFLAALAPQEALLAHFNFYKFLFIIQFLTLTG